MKFHFAADKSPDAQEAMGRLRSRYGQHALRQSDVIVAIGGDGFMLHMLHESMGSAQPIFGINYGSFGFLMNPDASDELETRIEQAQCVTLAPLRMDACTCATQEEVDGPRVRFAFNEVSLLRAYHQAAKVRVTIDGQVRLAELTGDGLLVATPAGSTAYNFSASGPILPLTSNLLALTPISPFRPRRWRGAILNDTVTVKVEILDSQKRAVLACADFQEVRDVCEVTIRLDSSRARRLLYDASHNLDERIMTEQFTC